MRHKVLQLRRNRMILSGFRQWRAKQITVLYTNWLVSIDHAWIHFRTPNLDPFSFYLISLPSPPLFCLFLPFLRLLRFPHPSPPVPWSFPPFSFSSLLPSFFFSFFFPGMVRWAWNAAGFAAARRCLGILVQKYYHDIVFVGFVRNQDE